METIRRHVILLVVIIIAGAVVYSFNLHNGLFWDDDDWIVNNPSVHALTWENVKFWFSNQVLAGIGMTSNYYRPVLFGTFAVNYAISGQEPVSYHIVSNGLHILNGVLLFFLFLSLLKRRTAAFIGALLFVIHPLNTEAVTYISGRGDPLNVFFLLCAMLLFLGAERKYLPFFSWPRISSFFLLVLALLSRETAIVFPFLVVIVAFILSTQGTGFLHRILSSTIKALPYLGIVLLYGISRLTVLNFSDTLNFYSRPTIYSENFHIRFFTFLASLMEYARLLIAPVGLYMDRQIAMHASFFQWPVWFAAVALIGAVLALRYFFLRERSDAKSADNKKNIPDELSNFTVCFFALAWFFSAILPMSGITPINAQIYEHWMYLPAIGLFSAVGWYLDKLLQFLNMKKKIVWRNSLIAALIFYAVWLCAISIQRNILWGKPIEFYQNILQHTPGSVRANNNLANNLNIAGRAQEAEEYYRRAIASEDTFPQPHFNIGAILQERGDFQGALEEYQKALVIDPRFHYAYRNLASLYAKTGNIPEAIEMLRKLQKLLPADPTIYYNLASAYFYLGDRQNALKSANEGLSFAQTEQDKEAFRAILTKIGAEP